MDMLFITARMQNLIIHLSLSVIYDFHFGLSFFIWLSYVSWKLIYHPLVLLHSLQPLNLRFQSAIIMFECPMLLKPLKVKRQLHTGCF